MEKDTLYIVNGIKQWKCNCSSNGKNYTLVDVGIITTGKFGCNSCKGRYNQDGKLWLLETWYESAEEKISDKYVAQVELLTLLANGHLPPESYKKIHNMLNGDEEMLNLANLLIKEHGKWNGDTT